jgi:hypothetical protein
MVNLGNQQQLLVVLAIALIVIVLVVAAFYAIRREATRKAMQRRFGPEYDRLVSEVGRKDAEHRLLQRQERVASYDIRELTPEERTRYERMWLSVQAAFVENPEAATARADELIANLMADRGYPMSDFDRRSSDLSVSHPVVVQNYRAGHDIVVRHREGNATTEDLRQAMVHYKTLFADLVAMPTDPAPVARHAA